MIKVCLNPNRDEDLPRSGGVREHIIQLRKFLARSDKVQLLPYRGAPLADIQHVEATYSFIIPNVPKIFTCHGGFLPHPIPSVIHNIQQADFVVSVAQWIVDKFIPKDFWHKIAIIPNGVDIAEFEDLPDISLPAGFVLYMKEWDHQFCDLLELSARMPKQHFVSVYWPDGQPIPSNVTYIGRQPREIMKAIIKSAGVLLSAGSEVNPIAVLEAFAVGTPVVARDCDGNAEVIRPYMPESSEQVGGLLYKSVREAAALINHALLDRQHIGQQGRKLVESYYQWRNLIKLYEGVYETIMEKALV